MQSFKDIFEAYGANYQETLVRFMGNEKMYMKLLDMFFKDENLDLLEKALKQNDTKAAFEAAHTLKGVTANMGLTPLYNSVCSIVECLRSNEDRSDYGEKCREIHDKYNEVKKLREDLINIGSGE